jgi:hypothetical protein
VRYLLDECLSDLTAKTMAVFGAPDEFVYIRALPGGQGADDPDISTICADEGFSTLITINVKDFGARRAIYEKVITDGINVLVLRTRSRTGATTNNWQVRLLAGEYPRYSTLFNSATRATLAVLTESGVRTTTMDEIITEIEARDTGKRPLP